MVATQNSTASVQEVLAGGTNGGKIGEASTDLVAFHGSTPVDQYAAITLTSGTLGDANTAVNSILSMLREKGLIAT